MGWGFLGAAEVVFGELIGQRFSRQPKPLHNALEITVCQMQFLFQNAALEVGHLGRQIRP